MYKRGGIAIKLIFPIDVVVIIKSLFSGIKVMPEISLNYVKYYVKNINFIKFMIYILLHN